MPNPVKSIRSLLSVSKGKAFLFPNYEKWSKNFVVTFGRFKPISIVVSISIKVIDMCKRYLFQVLLFTVVIILLLAALSFAEWPFRGISYPAWQADGYPFAPSWQIQTGFNSAAFQQLEVTSEYYLSPPGSLKIRAHFDRNNPDQWKGEAYVDLRYHPPLVLDPTLPPQYPPFDMQNDTVRVWVRFPANFVVSSSTPPSVS